MAGSRSGMLGRRSFGVLFVEGTMGARSDPDLIRLFVTGHAETAEAAFATLIVRHGPMVIGVCRRILRDEHAAEDAFQAVFLILARKARSVRVDDSLGRWLHGVTQRVAVRAKRRDRREVPAWVGLRGNAEDPALGAVRAEARDMIGLEVGRLPRKYREAVALCHIDGLTHEEAAEALGLPVGTVRSRLSRARDLLKTRLVRRGLAPGALAVWLGSRRASAGVPRALVEMASRNAGRAAGGMISPTVVVLVHQTTRSLLMAKVIGVGALAAALGCLTTGAVLVSGGGNGTAKSAAQEVGLDVRPASLEDQYQRFFIKFKQMQDRAQELGASAESKEERSRIYTEVYPDETDYARRVVELATEHPKERATRDALIWVLNRTNRWDVGAFGDEFSRAVDLLVTHHADDPEVARVGLNLDNLVSRRRDAFLEGIYANAQGREAKGMARMAMAKYLEMKAACVTAARKTSGRSSIRMVGHDVNGDPVDKSIALSNEEEGYQVNLRMLDPDFIRRESERLYEEVIAEYSDLPYLTTDYRAYEREARKNPSATIADPTKKSEMIVAENYLASCKKQTLGQFAERRLAGHRSLMEGKVAPDFEKVGVDGKVIAKE